MDLASSCIKGQILQLFHVNREIVEWSEKCHESKCFCTPPQISGIDFKTMYYQLMPKNYVLLIKHFLVYVCKYKQLCSSFQICQLEYRGTRWRSWLRHCATNRNVVGSIPDGVTGIFH